MMDQEDNEQKVLEEIARMIAEYRREYLDGIVRAIQEECSKINDDEQFDPAAGRNRGPWWAA